VKISAQGLVKAYKGRRVVDDVSFSFDQGEVVGLLGPNGAGKTTTFYMVTGLIQPNAGTVSFDDNVVTSWPMYRRARAGVGYLAQETSVFRNLSIADNIRLVLEAAGKPRKEIEDTVARLLKELHIEKIASQKGRVLSGGERRRVEIARALATEPRFILLDEPFTGIDPVTIEELQHIIRRLSKQGIGILITDHNVAATLSITDRNYILIDGKIIAQGDRKEIEQNALVRKHYLGEGFDPDRHPPQGEGA
jgi:lipopolysaccharide export system ATP-binding protein